MQRARTHALTTLKVLASIWLFWTIAAPSAQAYIDPGSSSFIIQILIGALAGAGLAIATFWSRIRNFFSKRKDKDAAPTTPASSSSAPPAATPPPAPPAAPEVTPPTSTPE